MKSSATCKMVSSKRTSRPSKQNQGANNECLTLNQSWPCKICDEKIADMHEKRIGNDSINCNGECDGWIHWR